MSWLLEVCLGNLGINKDPAPTPVRIESLHVLSAIGSSYFKLMETHLDSVALAIGGALADQYTESKLHAGRCLDSIGHAINLYLSDEDSVKKITGPQCAVFWHGLSTPLSELFQDQHNPSLRAVACDCLGNIGGEVFKHFSRDKQIVVVTMLFGCAKDQEAVVRAAAVRALAVCVVFPSLREDFGFVMDTAEAILELMKESNLQVRIKASWSLGNLTDALVCNINDNECEDIPADMLLNLLRISIVAAKDNDKVRCNAMRAIGNLLRILNSTLIMKSEWKEVINEAITRLVNSTGTMKVRWNACHALGNVLKNNNLFLPSIGLNWQKSVFSALNELVIGSRNFKVRINAAMSLAVPAHRKEYGTHYIGVYGSLIKALDNTSNMEDFSEYKHRDNLVDQICLSLAHLTCLCVVEDLCAIQDMIVFHLDIVKQDVTRVTGRILPEKGSNFLKAGMHVEDISTSNLEQKLAIKTISSIFVQKELTYDCY